MNRLAVIGDIHAQDARLESALTAIRTLNVDVVGCTGDVVDGPGSADRCCALLREYRVLCVRGNHDRWVFTGLLRDTPGATGLHQLTAEHQQFLKRLPPFLELPTAQGLMLLCHGIGTFDLEKITSYDTDYSIRMNRRLQDVVNAGKYRLMVNGHSHERLLMTVGHLRIVNAGTLNHRDDPGFALLDFDRNVVQWHSVRSPHTVVSDEQKLF